MSFPLPYYWFGGSESGAERAADRRVAVAESAALVTAIQRGDPDAVTSLYRVYFERLTRYAHQLTRDRELAETGTSPGMAAMERGAAEQLERRELDALIARAVAALPPRQREALALRWSHGLRYADAARVMSVSEARVRQLVARAEEQVREAVGGYVSDG